MVIRLSTQEKHKREKDSVKNQKCSCAIIKEGPYVRKSKGVEREIIRLDELNPIYTVLKLKQNL